MDSDGNCTPTPVLPTREADGVSYIREIKIAFAANMNLYHVTSFPFTYRLLSIITTRKAVDSRHFSL